MKEIRKSDSNGMWKTDVIHYLTSTIWSISRLTNKCLNMFARGIVEQQHSRVRKLFDRQTISQFTLPFKWRANITTYPKTRLLVFNEGGLCRKTHITHPSLNQINYMVQCYFRMNKLTKRTHFRVIQFWKGERYYNWKSDNTMLRTTKWVFDNYVGVDSRSWLIVKEHIQKRHTILTASYSPNCY